MTAITTRIIAEPTEADHLAILNPLLAFNETKTGDDRYRPLAIALSDETGQVAGGLWAKFYYDWLFVELLFVPEKLRGRGLGASLLLQAEEWARNHSRNGIWLDTFSFQAPGFYEKQGYTLFGAIDDYPSRHRRMFFRKLLSAASA
jgi:GNAT superfamily N-acetyltransferase